MYNPLHVIASRGMRDTAPRSRRPQPTAQPAGISHLTLIQGDGPAAADAARHRPARDALRPPESQPSG